MARWVVTLAALLAACGHSAPFTAADIAPLGPISSGSDIPLTMNPGEDYWPAWTEDGRGILYQYSQPGRPDDDRCIGLLPAGGGTQIWTLCDTRLAETDSTNGFAAFALGSDGRLLYFEAVSPIGSQGTPRGAVLWLADSAHPFTRRALATFPATVGTRTVGWLADAVWTGPSTFMVLGQDFTEVAHCHGCSTSDTLFANGVVLAGSTGSAGAGLVAIPGTNGAVDFSVAESGASVVFATANSGVVQRIRLAGDSADTVASLPSGRTINGVSCRATTCAVTANAGSVNGELWSVDLASHAVTMLASAVVPPASIGPAWYTGHLSPVSGDVVLQSGGSLGYQDIDNDAGSTLHLLRNIVP